MHKMAQTSSRKPFCIDNTSKDKTANAKDYVASLYRFLHGKGKQKAPSQRIGACICVILRAARAAGDYA
jgi:hypothetical protein